MTLASIAPQAAAAGAEVIVINDGDSLASVRVAERHGARVVGLAPPGGANAARNAGIRAAAGDLIVLVDDDVHAPEGWLAEMLAGAASAAEAEVFGGPIRARLEGGGPRSCGRESAPITTLDLGPDDRDAELVWSANMAVRRRALQRVGRFDETIRVRGDEEDWERRYLAAGGRIRYVAAAGLDHRRTAADATVRRLARAAFAQGRSVASLRRDQGHNAPAERRTAHAGGLRVAHLPPPVPQRRGPDRARRRPAARGTGWSSTVSTAVHTDDFMSGTSGHVHGIRATTRAVLADAVCDAIALAHFTPVRLPAARRLPGRGDGSWRWGLSAPTCPT